jgi:hypothetical protein
VVALVFPELLLHLDYSAMRFMDSEFIYTAVFSIARDLGGLRLQLWNDYDQMPLAFYYLTGGMTYANVLTALAYSVSSPFVPDQAQWFFANYTVVYNVVTTVIRTLGVYLLAALFTRNAVTLLCTSVFAATIAAMPNYLGLNCGALYALFPFVAFFLQRWVDSRRAIDLLLFVLSLTAAITFDPLVGLGYFYQGVHFLVLSSLLWLAAMWLIKAPLPVRAIEGGARPGKPQHWVAALIAVPVVLGPWAALLLTNYGDYELAHESSRFARLLSVSAYFENQHFGANPRLLPALLVEFSKNQWAFQWVFVGWIFLFFVLCGAILSEDRRRYIFILTAVAFWLLQFPRDPGSALSVAHWLNALTNPFNSIVRSAHMTGAFLLPYVLLPLFVLGFDAFFKLCRGAVRPPSAPRLALLLLVLASTSLLAWRYSAALRGSRPSTELAYLVLLPAVLAGALLTVRSGRTAGPRAMAIGAAVVAGALLADLAALRHYVQDVARHMHVTGHRFNGIPERFQPVRIDRQNPHILPVREYYVFDPPGQPVAYIGTDPINMQGLLYQYTNLGKYLDAPSNYKPRHKAYRVLHTDPVFRQYLARDTRLSFLAEAAVPDLPGALEQIVEHGLERRVIVVSGADRIADAWPHQALARLQEAPADERTPAWTEIRFRMGDATGSELVYGGRRLVFALPKGFPRWLASTPFTADRDNLAVQVDGRDLVAVQGWTDRLGTFDLQNVRQGTLQLVVARAIAENPGRPLVLRYRFATPVNAGSVHTRSPDTLGFSVRTDRPRWLLLHMPYDTRWRFSVNGEKAEHFRANRAFTAIRLPAGDSDVTASYWPASPLRILVPVSFAFCSALLIVLFVVGFRISRVRPSLADRDPQDAGAASPAARAE